MAVLNARVSASTLHKKPKVTQDTQAYSSGSLQPRSLTPFLLKVSGIKCRTALLLPGVNTEKIWAHRFLEKPKTIEAGGLGQTVSPPWGPGRCLGERVGANPPNNFAFFFL